MASVYRLHTVKAWDTWRTPAAFFTTALLLGQLWVAVFLFLNRSLSLKFLDDPQPFFLVTAVLFSLTLFLELSSTSITGQAIHKNRLVLILVGLSASAIMVLIPGKFAYWVTIPLFILAAIEEIIGRKRFYDARELEF